MDKSIRKLLVVIKKMDDELEENHELMNRYQHLKRCFSAKKAIFEWKKEIVTKLNVKGNTCNIDEVLKSKLRDLEDKRTEYRRSVREIGAKRWRDCR